ncbi:hypothetical protein ACK3SF_02995 [Candidatus Nanosalina sp. VS9-1]|uniref:hypothetical protein n=1 Tax=Candidatus Nanosalina sp. VS9-1 TaxID=3388566 RepID=UPI0039E19F77
MEPELVQDYFQHRLNDAVVQDEKLALYLLVIGERPGVLIMNPDMKDRNILEDFCREFDLEYIYTGGEGERGLLDKILRRDSRLFKGGFFIASDGERFEELESTEGRFYGFSDEGVGEFLGYPEDDVEYFASNVVEGHIERPTREKAEELVSEGVIRKKDLKYLELVSYVPRPEEENIVEAVELGKKREEKILEIDEDLGIDTGAKILGQIFNDPLYSE